MNKVNKQQYQDFFIDFKEPGSGGNPVFMEAFNVFQLFKGKHRKEAIELWNNTKLGYNGTFYIDSIKDKVWIIFVPYRGDITNGYVFNQDSFYFMDIHALSYINFPVPND